MKKEKFVYNTQTLRYEKVEVSWSVKLLRVFAIACALLVFSTIIAFFALNFFASPREKVLLRELEQMKHQYEVVNEEMELHAKVLENLQQRDANVHRMIFGMDPIDRGIWEGGVGGSKKYEHLATYKNSGKVMVQTMQRLDKLKRKMAIQSESIDSVVIMLKEKNKMLSSIPSIKPIREDKLSKSMSQLSGFGMRVHPIFRVRKMHTGIDFTSPKGTPIYSTGDGKVVRVQSAGSGYGNNVIVDHGYGYQTLYGHMSTMSVKPGQVVKKGQKIGLVGSTGRSTAPHLHYEVHYKGKPVNPIDYCQDGLTPKEYSQLVELSQVGNISFD